MSCLKIPCIAELNAGSAMEEVSSALDRLEKNAINIASWDAYLYTPNVEFSIAHGKNCIFIKYYVHEDAVKISCNQPNDPVFKDSCVEFFIAFNSEKGFYNLEFNAIGTCMAMFGTSKTDRMFVPADIISKIRHQTVLQNKTINGAAKFYWEICLIIPVELFTSHHFETLSGIKATVNFYKCGDDLPVPHFLSWRKISTPEPNFHTPGFFGDAVFL